MDDEVESSIKWVARGASFMLIGTFASKGIMYFYRIFVARYLGAADYGLLSLALATFWISMTFASLSIPSGVTRFVSKYVGRGEEGKVKGTILSSLEITVPTALATAVIVFVSAPLIASRVFGNAELTIFIRIFAIAMPFQMLYQVFSSVANAYKRLEYTAVVDKLYRSLATLLVTVGLVLGGYGLMGAVIAQLVAISTAGLLIVYLVETRVFPFLKESSDGFRNRREMLYYSYPLLLGSVIGQVTGWTDTVMLGFFDTASSVGVYNAALPTAQVIGVFGGAFGSILFPVVSEMYGKGEKRESVEVAATTLKWIFSFSFPFLLITVAFSQPILKLLFGNAYLTGSVALAVLAVAYFTQTLTGYGGTFIQTEERTKLIFANSVAVAVLNFGLNVFLIPYFMEIGAGSTGAGIATATSLAFGGLLAILETYYLFGVQPVRMKKLLPPTGAAIVAAVAVYATVKSFYDPTPTWVLVPAFTAFGLLYGLLFLLFGGLQEDDITVLKAAERKTGHEFPRLKEVVRRLAR